MLYLDSEAPWFMFSGGTDGVVTCSEAPWFIFSGGADGLVT